MKILIIGLGGVTNGGKTTLARKLKEHLPNCTIISQDDFFKPESEVAVDDNGFLQYDVLDALHMDRMVMNIHSWMTNPEDSVLTRPPERTYDDQKRAEDMRILIVEGFLLYNYNNRVYNPPDTPGYFDGHVWPMYLKHKREMEENETDIVYLDGMQSQEDLYSKVYSDIVQEMKKTGEQGTTMRV
ncbi:nicotinamide riboside kinase 1 isoform X2 [Sceloporus undulatus]|uniref:nicotinamide riboside kinase 1 isoform X2 n=1 Tax=Sceloporus undulatus TaxID=8520 RepID=UPI001C4C6D66|nr:nicotinamide riboside kinase 1 isoform X2 [Sceloporus undulatus]